MLCTGYFAKTKEYTGAGMTPVSVSGRTPAFFKYPKWTKLAPKKELFWSWKRGEISNEEYMKQYEEFLDSTISDKVLSNIKLLISQKDIVLCCYEKPEDFCHRHTLAEWLEKKLSTLIGEVSIAKI